MQKIVLQMSKNVTFHCFGVCRVHPISIDLSSLASFAEMQMRLSLEICTCLKCHQDESEPLQCQLRRKREKEQLLLLCS